MHRTAQCTSTWQTCSFAGVKYNRHGPSSQQGFTTISERGFFFLGKKVLSSESRESIAVQYKCLAGIRKDVCVCMCGCMCKKTNACLESFDHPPPTTLHRLLVSDWLAGEPPFAVTHLYKASLLSRSPIHSLDTLPHSPTTTSPNESSSSLSSQGFLLPSHTSHNTHAMSPTKGLSKTWVSSPSTLALAAMLLSATVVQGLPASSSPVTPILAAPSSGEDACATFWKRQDCGFVGITEEGCQQRQCCWSTTVVPTIPWCFQKAVTIILFPSCFAASYCYAAAAASPF